MISIRKQIEQEKSRKRAGVTEKIMRQQNYSRPCRTSGKNIRDIMFHCVTPCCLVESNVARRYRSGSASPGSVSFSAEMLRHGCQDCTYQYPRQSEMV